MNEYIPVREKERGKREGRGGGVVSAIKNRL